LVDGSLIRDHKEIRQSFHVYFSSIFGTTLSFKLELDWDQLYPNNHIDISSLDMPFSIEEIKKGVFDMGADKAPWT